MFNQGEISLCTYMFPKVYWNLDIMIFSFFFIFFIFFYYTEGICFY